MKKTIVACLLLGSLTVFGGNCLAQISERERPEEWQNLVEGGKFIDLFQPITPIGILTTDIWGTDGVIPRYIDNGIEDNSYSYWGGNIIAGEDGKYHLFVCRWREDSPKGHAEWPNSMVVHAVAESPKGPFRFLQEVGKGHNPEIYRTDAGAYVIYVIDGFYQSTSLEGPWEYGKFEFDPRDRPIIEGLSNLTFSKREDGSFLMICRGGGVWFSKDGLETYRQVSNQRVYPPVEGEFEDPVVWKDHVQYHLIVNDWLGRIAFYLRSKDGVHWETDPGEAYAPGITVYEDGTEEDWFKYERIKVFQDEYGRAVQANFAVIDTLKKEDRPNDSHSSKNVVIPLKKSLLLQVLEKQPINSNTQTIRLLIKAEDGFDPQTSLEIQSLRFGASAEVNFGRGSKPISHRFVGKDLEVIFDGGGNGISEEIFAGKLLGKSVDGDMVYGFSRLPGVDYTPAILSTLKPNLDFDDNSIGILVENFGLSNSVNAILSIELVQEGTIIHQAEGKLKPLKSYESTLVKLPLTPQVSKSSSLEYKVTIRTGEKLIEVFEGKLDDN